MWWVARDSSIKTVIGGLYGGRLTCRLMETDLVDENANSLLLFPKEDHSLGPLIKNSKNMKMSAKLWWNDADKENLCTRGKPLPTPLCPPQVARGLAGFFFILNDLYISRSGLGWRRRYSDSP